MTLRSKSYKRTKEVPRSYSEEVALDEYVVVFQNMLDVLGMIDDNARRQ